MTSHRQAYDLNLTLMEDGPLVVLSKECGYRPAQTELLMRYRAWTNNLVTYLARRTKLNEHDVEDASQDAVFAVLIAIARYRTCELGKPAGCSFRSFLRRVVTDRFKDFLKQHWRRKNRFGRSLPYSIAEGDLPLNSRQHGPTHVCQWREMNDRLGTYMDRLNVQTRRFLEELLSGTSLRCAGQKVGLSYDQAKRARRKIRSELERFLVND